MAVRAMTYNIRTGGYDGADQSRLAGVAAVVDRIRPDLLALQELRGFDRRRLAGLAESWGMTGHLARSVSGQPVAVLVRPPARIVAAGSVHRPFHHAAARVTVATDRGPLTVLGTHLQPYSGGWRVREAGWLTAPARPRRGTGGVPMVLLMGDLNSLDPWTDHRERIERLPPAYRGRHLTRGAVDTRAVAALDRAGFVDLFRLAGTGEVTHTAPTTRGGGAEFSGMRLDYILGTAPVAEMAQECRVVTGGDTEWASDHYPVIADLDLSPVG
ncbi:endonuclease/exonuclease/phosphatase family protein [Polymorphospora lycopeni]|uniref:Endonuclease/exonuclease/phosphatase family protein n=1 Tax=Polymorphospora lycopeni TaxID=3140240 RepID=A0ABV5CVC1_9ACTN